MNFTMTFYTNRYNIKPMLRRIALVMVILLCLRGTIMALQGIGMGQFTSSNSIIYNVHGFSMIWIMSMKTLVRFTLRKFTFFAMGIMFSGNFAFFTLPIFSLCNLIAFELLVFFLILFLLLTATKFADITMSIMHFWMFMKFGYAFCFFANSAGFKYDLLSHNRLINRRLRLEPVSGYIPVSGSSYCKLPMSNVNK